MSEIQRRDAQADAEVGAAVDRDAKIEQLLLVGLDHYFGARYEQAINVWTRALFLDRNHPRARAYIERARSALAEGQRQSEELLHSGVAAFHRGEGDEARRLLQAAIEGGAPAEEALAILERLNRSLPIAEPAAPEESPAPDRPRRGIRPLVGQGAERGSRSRIGAIALLATVAALVVGGYAVWVAQADWRSLVPFVPAAEPAARATAPLPQASTLPPPRRGEMALARARMLAAGGHLHEALTALDAVRPTDSQKDEADRLRADIQRQLLALTVMPATPDRDRTDRRLP